MQEKLVIVPKKTTGGHKAGMIAFFVLTCLCLVLSMFVSPVMFLVPTIIFGVIWYLFAFRRRVTLPDDQEVRHQPCRVKCAVIFRYLSRVNLRTS